MSALVRVTRLLNASKWQCWPAGFCFAGGTLSGGTSFIGNKHLKIKQFATVLKDVQENGSAVKWVEHNQCGLVFSQSVHFHN